MPGVNRSSSSASSCARRVDERVEPVAVHAHGALLLAVDEDLHASLAAEHEVHLRRVEAQRGASRRRLRARAPQHRPLPAEREVVLRHRCGEAVRRRAPRLQLALPTKRSARAYPRYDSGVSSPLGVSSLTCVLVPRSTPSSFADQRLRSRRTRPRRSARAARGRACRSGTPRASTGSSTRSRSRSRCPGRPDSGRRGAEPRPRRSTRRARTRTPGVCTPTITSPALRYFASHASSCGSVRRQLMHEYVQKSTSTTLPRSFCIVSGAELNQRPPPASDGRRAVVGQRRGRASAPRRTCVLP